MKNSKTILLWFVTFILIGCTGQQTPAKQSTITPPTVPAIQPPTAQPTQSPTLPPTVLPTFPPSLDRLRMAFTQNGSLYFQDGIKTPIQLTFSGEDRDPIISSDGEKIVFYRGEAFDNVYSINADGSQEQAIIESQSLPVLGRGDIKALTFVPKSHFLLFNTFLCNPSEALYNAPDCTVGIYSTNADSGELSELISGLSGNALQERNFVVSPDGGYISVATSGHIDIYSLYTQQVEIFQQNVILYNPTIPDEFLPLQYWFPDSDNLLALLPASEYNEPGTPPHIFTAWRYTVDENLAIQILLDPPIIFLWTCNFSVSPDRSWIFYVSDGIPSLYLGNLNDGRTQSYKDGCPSSSVISPQWSSDSKHFASQSTIVAIDGTSILIDGDFRGWIDASYYFYETIEESKRKIYIGEIDGESIALPEGYQWSPTYVILNQ
jgi:hypothetical protein